MNVSLVSFGYNYGRGIPRADLVIDCRGLHNPHRQARGRDGRDEHVAARVAASDGAPELLATALLALTSGKARSVAFGCSWGVHRSVAMAEVLAFQISKVPGVQVAVFHRDLAIRQRALAKSAQRRA